jgi:hypothetical protein
VRHGGHPYKKTFYKSRQRATYSDTPIPFSFSDKFFLDGGNKISLSSELDWTKL